MSRIFLLLISLFLLSSCIQDPQGFLRKSANNRYFDTKGFNASKRMPAYNAKYIERAKQNIYANKYDEENTEEFAEVDEIENPAAYHREIYRQMVMDEKSLGDKDQKHQKKKRKKSKNTFFSKLAYHEDVMNAEHQQQADDEEFVNHRTRQVTSPRMQEVVLKEARDEGERQVFGSLDDFDDDLDYRDGHDRQKQASSAESKAAYFAKLQAQKSTKTEAEEDIFGDSKFDNVSDNFFEDKQKSNLPNNELAEEKIKLQQELAEMRSMLSAIRDEIAIINRRREGEALDTESSLSFNDQAKFNIDFEEEITQGYQSGFLIY